MNDILRNYVKLKGNEYCPIHYLIPRGAIIQNIYEVLHETNEIYNNYSKIDLNKTNSVALLRNDEDFVINNNFLQYKKKQVGDNTSIYLIIEFKDVEKR